MTFAYDNARNKTASTDGNGNTTQYSYDARKRLTQTTYQDGTTKTNTYDGPGNLASVTDQAGNTVQYTYDTANQLQSVIQLAHPIPAHNTNSYAYDALGNLATLTDENGHSTVNGFDLLSNPATKTLPDGSLTETRTYDTAGNLIALQHFNGKTTTYAYDQLNRLITRTPDPSLGEPTVSFTYTTTGKRASMKDGSGTTTYTYDSLDRLSSKTTPAGTLNYTYDAAGHVASIISSNPHGSSVNYTYDSLGRLSTVVDNNLPAGKNTTTYTYDTASNVVTVTLPNGIVSTSHYDQLNRLTSLTSPVSSYTYQLSPTGNRTSSSELNGRTLTWNYNGVYQLTEQTVASDPAGVDGSATYGLDPVGNRLSTSSTLTGILNGTYAYNPDDEIGSETYDPNGNVLTEGAKTFTYDSENRLTTMNGAAVSIVYDGDGNLVAETAGGVTTRYLVDDLNPTGYSQVIDEVVNVAAVREYALGLQRIDESQPINGTWTPSFYGYDGGGTVRQLTNLSGSVSDTYEYDAFGYLLTSTGTTSNSYLYRGEQYDPNLGLYYLRARYYNPITGRLLSRDAEDGNGDDPKTLHKYIYADGDPANRYDPSGREGAVLDPPVQAPPKAAGGDLAEYGLIVTAISLTAVAALPPVADEVNCVLSNAYTLLFGLAANAGSPVTIRQSSKCVKQVRKKRSCAIDNPQLPVQYVHAIPIPTIALHILLAQQAGRPDKLTYLGPKNPQQELNRKAACPAGKYGGSGTECDEYPYASTVEGGALASTAPVPASQHRRQGGSLGPFYKTISPGQQFCVEVVP